MKLKLGKINSFEWNTYKNLNSKSEGNLLKINQDDGSNDGTLNSDDISILISVSAIGDLIIWDRKKGNKILVYNIENGSINAMNTEIYINKRLIFSFGFQG